jgi:hypothetical protein
MNSQLSNAQFQKWNILTQKCCKITVDVTPYGLGDVHRRYRGRCRLSFHWRFLTKLQQVRIPQTVRCRIPEHLYIYTNFPRFATKQFTVCNWVSVAYKYRDYFVSQTDNNYVARILPTWTSSVSDRLGITGTTNVLRHCLRTNKRCNWSTGMWCHPCVINWEQ